MTNRVTHTRTTVVGTNAVTLTYDHDTTISGSTVSGKMVTATVGGNLNISSLQDTDTYRSTSKSSGVSISYTPGRAGIVSGGQTTGKINSDYRSVAQQAGIYAGTGGYDITTNGTTRLTGAVIAGKADKETNRLTTGNLIMQDIQNEASYSAGSGGFNLSTDKGTALNPLGLGKVTSIPVKSEAASTTRSAIAEGIILVAGKRSDKEINHNTEEALQRLGTIFDKVRLIQWVLGCPLNLVVLSRG